MHITPPPLCDEPAAVVNCVTVPPAGRAADMDGGGAWVGLHTLFGFGPKDFCASVLNVGTLVGSLGYLPSVFITGGIPLDSCLELFLVLFSLCTSCLYAFVVIEPDLLDYLGQTHWCLCWG